MALDNVLASVAVARLADARPWYERLLGRAPDGTPMPEVAEWRFARGGCLQVYGQPERAGGGSFTLAVTGLDAEAERLGALGFDVSQRTASPQVKTLMFTDPDGNHIALAEALGADLAR